jgi:PucR family transcriptional regulator, purine catabolism regulatory protein
MSNITVSEALELPELQSLEIIAGEKGLYRDIRDVTVLEVPDPVHWLKGGELLLTTFYGIRENQDAQVTLLKKVAPTVAGICFNPGTGTILSPEIIKMADKLSLPLLRMPGDMPYAMVIRSVLQAILNRRAFLLSRSSEINSILINTILNGAEAKEVVSTLSQLVKNPVALLDASLNPVAEDSYYEGGQDLLKNGLPQLLSLDIFHDKKISAEHPTYAHLNIKNQELRVGVKAVMIKSSVYGYLTVWEALKRFDEVDIYAIAHASTAIAIDFIRSTSLAEQRQKMINNLCENLFSGSYVSEDSIIKQGEMYGLNLGCLNVAIVVQTVAPGSQMTDCSQMLDITGETDEVVAALRKLIESQVADSLVASRGGEIIIAVDAGKDENRKKRVSDLTHDISRICYRFFDEGSVLISVGSFVGHFKDLVQSYSQAKAALKMIKYLTESKNRIFFDELGIYRLLCEIPHTPGVRQYVEMVLPGIDSCEKSMLETLEIYIECQKSFSAAGKKLYVHPNTVKYRINKVREKWGEDILLDNNCLDTLVALKLKKIF